MTELRNMVKNEGKKYTDFVTYLTISLLDSNGEEAAAWDPVKVNLAASPGDDYYTDAVIKSASYDCGFCPKIGNTYRIKASIYLDGQRILYGTYDNVPVAENVKNAGSLYQPSPLPGETNHYELKLGCSFYNTLPGSAAGTVTITTVSESTAGTFGIYWLGKDGGPSPPPWAIKC